MFSFHTPLYVVLSQYGVRGQRTKTKPFSFFCKVLLFGFPSGEDSSMS